MSKQSNGKLRLLYVLDILKKYSDEDAPLNSADIIERLCGMGIPADRKTVYDDIAALEAYGCDIIKTGTPKKGWFIGEREFEIPEIYLLCDAVRSAKFISPKKTRELVQKLNSMMSLNNAKGQGDAVFFNLDDKCSNEEIYYHIDKINRAIKAKRRINLKYATRFFGKDRSIERRIKEMVINPYALAWQDDCYYLIGNHARYDNLIHLRLDKITAIEITDTPSRHFSEVSRYREYFDTADYLSGIFGMFSGELEEIELCCNRRVTEQVLDRFSENIFIKNVTENEFSFRVKAAVSPALVTWIINYGGDIRAVRPERLKEMIKKRAEDILKSYENA